MKLGCLLPILAVGLVSAGAHGLYVGLANRTPSAMSYREFLQKKPSSGWIEVTDARLDLLSTIQQSNRFTGTIKKAYIPVGSGAEGEQVGDGKIHLLLLTKDAAILKTLKDLETATGGGGGLLGRLKRRVEANKRKRDGANEKPAGDPALENALRFVVENGDQILIERPVRGLIQSGLDSMSQGDRRKIQAANPDIAPDFVVLEDGAEPQLAASVFMVIAGLGLAGLLLFRLRRAKPSTPPASSSPGALSATAGPESAKDVEFWASDTG
jgi:hypothetical protein